MRVRRVRLGLNFRIPVRCRTLFLSHFAAPQPLPRRLLHTRVGSSLLECTRRARVSERQVRASRVRKIAAERVHARVQVRLRASFIRTRVRSRRCLESWTKESLWEKPPKAPPSPPSFVAEKLARASFEMSRGMLFRSRNFRDWIFFHSARAEDLSVGKVSARVAIRSTRWPGPWFIIRGVHARIRRWRLLRAVRGFTSLDWTRIERELMPGANPATRWLRGGPAGQLPSFAPTLHRSRLIGLFAGNRKSRPELPIRTVNAFLLAGCDSLHRRIDDDSLIFLRGDALLEISRTRVVLSHFGQGPNYIRIERNIQTREKGSIVGIIPRVIL